MRIVLVGVGTRGDVQPFLALGKRLQRDGHQVSLATSREFEAFVRAHGLDFAALEGNPREEFVARGFGPEMIQINPFRLLRGLREMAGPLLERYFADIERACVGADLVLWGFWGVPAVHVAEKYGIPSMGALVQPWTRTRAFASVGWPLRSNMGAPLNWLTHVVAEQSLWQLFRPQWNDWRKRRLGLRPLPIWGPYGIMLRSHYPILYGFSPRVVPRPPNWQDNVTVTGYWFLDGQPGWQPPAGLLDFLRAGPPPVYVGFGSMATGAEQRITEIALQALKRSGQRGLIVSGWGGLGQGETSDHSVFVIESAPHDWLFPQMAALVHHGGSGTVAAGLRAGVPTIVVPHFADQPFWGWRVQRLGVGPKPIPRPRLTAERLAAAIRVAVSDPAMRERAARLGEAIRAEDGTGNAVQAIYRNLNL